MQFGLMYLFSDFGKVPQERVFKEVLDEIEYAEELGFARHVIPVIKGSAGSTRKEV